MDVFAPHSLQEAVDIKAVHPEATPVAGGTDLMVDLNARRVRPGALLDLSHVAELRSWWRDDGRVFVGATMTFARIADQLSDFPALVSAARSVGSPQIRSRATIGGNLATASPAGDSLPVLAVYGAQVVTASSSTWMRRVPLVEFLVGPKRTSLGGDELVVGVEWSPTPGFESFTKVGRRNAMVIALASSCIKVDREEHAVRLALGSVAPTVLRASHAEEFAAANDWSDPRARAEFARLAAAETSPIDDLRGSAAYRRHAVEVLARRELERAEAEEC
jgi:CO/xanthine dehydrogenase FAD-binding subunit